MAGAGEVSAVLAGQYHSTRDTDDAIAGLPSVGAS